MLLFEIHAVTTKTGSFGHFENPRKGLQRERQLLRHHQILSKKAFYQELPNHPQTFTSSNRLIHGSSSKTDILSVFGWFVIRNPHPGGNQRKSTQKPLKGEKKGSANTPQSFPLHFSGCLQVVSSHPTPR